MKHNEFGDIRSWVQTPSPAHWASLCEALETAPARELREELLPYALDHLRSWPHELRAMPDAWVARAMSGEEVEVGCICRRAHIKTQTPNDLRVLLSTSLLSEINTLKLSMASAPGRCLRVLSQASLPSLRALDLSGNRLGDRSVRALKESTWLVALECLNLGQNRLTYQGLRALTRADLGVRCLDLSDNRLGARAAHLIARHPGFSKLQTLGLHGCVLTPDAREALATSPTLCAEIRANFASSVA